MDVNNQIATTFTAIQQDKINVMQVLLKLNCRVMLD